MKRWSSGFAFGTLLLLLTVMVVWMISLRREIAVRRRAESQIAALLHDLRERIKELTALHQTARLLQQERPVDQEFLSEWVALLPPAWHYPEICEARVAFNELSAATPGWRETPWKQCVSFSTSDGHAGVIEVAYLDERPPAAEGPFLAEERTLIQSLADMLSVHLEQQQLEGQLRQTQKLEALGTLAGGIAHDFNNILGAIVSFTELSKMDNPDNLELQENLQQVLKASNRATNLVRQILSFSRQQKQERKSIQLAPVAKEALKLLRSTLPSTIEIEQRFAPGLPDVLADPTQMHQVTMNLCTNAAQSLENKKGRLVVELDLFQLSNDAPSPHPDLIAGSYLRLTVSDTGHGMDQAVLHRIFEPFFTTKKPGEGTGLGLAVVHGIVKDHDGVIIAASQPGQGTTFSIYLPAIGPAAEVEYEPLTDVPRGRGERILFVDDEAALCEVAQRVMTRLGYKPIVFRRSAEAWKAVHDAPGQFAAVVSDLTMPGMTGIELARRILALQPATLVILTSGFSGGLTDESVRELGIRALIQKPLDYRALAFAVDAALHGPKSPDRQI